MLSRYGQFYMNIDRRVDKVRHICPRAGLFKPAERKYGYNQLNLCIRYKGQ